MLMEQASVLPIIMEVSKGQRKNMCFSNGGLSHMETWRKASMVPFKQIALGIYAGSNTYKM